MCWFGVIQKRTKNIQIFRGRLAQSGSCFSEAENHLPRWKLSTSFHCSQAGCLAVTVRWSPSFYVWYYWGQNFRVGHQRWESLSTSSTPFLLAKSEFLWVEPFHACLLLQNSIGDHIPSLFTFCWQQRQQFFRFTIYMYLHGTSWDHSGHPHLFDQLGVTFSPKLREAKIAGARPSMRRTTSVSPWWMPSLSPSFPQLGGQQWSPKIPA